MTVGRGSNKRPLLLPQVSASPSVRAMMLRNIMILSCIKAFPKSLMLAIHKSFEFLRDSLVCGDSRDMSMIPPNSVQLMVTSPPYNVSKEYDEDLSLQEYLAMLKDVFTETYRVLAPGGEQSSMSLMLAVSHTFH